MNGIFRSLRLALRSLSRAPGFSLAVVLMLALGIGVNTLIFSFVHPVLVEPLPFKEADRLVMMWETNPREDVAETSVSPANYLDWKGRGDLFEDMAAFHPETLVVTGDGEPEQVPGTRVTPEFFSLFGARPLLGSAEVGDERAVVIDHGFWRRRFGGDKGVVGHTLSINQVPHVVAGVMPPGFDFPSESEVWLPRALEAEEQPRRDFQYLNVVARLRPGASLEQADAAMGALASGLAEQYPETNTGWGVKLVPLREQMIGEVGTALRILLGTGGFVLLLACVNVANLLLARSVERQREVALRTAMGAKKRDLAQLFLSESLVLVVFGATLATVLTVWGGQLLLRLSPVDIPLVDELRLSGSELAFLAFLSLASGLIFALVPRLVGSSPNLYEFLREGGEKSSAGPRRHRIHNVFMVAVVALAFTLLIGAGLMLRSFNALLNVEPGFAADEVLSLVLRLPRTKYPERHQQATFFGDVLGQIETMPGVKGAGGTTTLPLEGSGLAFTFELERPPPQFAGESLEAGFDITTRDYFRTMGIELATGRYFDERDTSTGQPVAIVNETMARRYWPDGDPLGQRLVLQLRDRESREIVGVIRDIKHSSLESDSREEIYVPFEQFPVGTLTLVLRSGHDPNSLVGDVRRTILNADPELPVASVRTMKEIYDSSMARQRFTAVLLAIFATAGLLLAVVGVYSVMAYNFSRRVREFGIRMALGASRGQVLKMVVARGMQLASFGLAIGMLAAWVLGRFMSSLLFEVNRTDPLTFLGAWLLLSGVAALAIWVPARRATGLAPSIALRTE